MGNESSTDLQPAKCGAGTAECGGTVNPQAYFKRMIPHCLDYARAAKAAGRPIVGIMCEFTPRELIMAAGVADTGEQDSGGDMGGVPVCLCGGSAKTVAVAEQELPTNLCPLIKSTYGYHLAKSNPFLEMADLIVAETTCDGKKKMYELLAQSRPMYILELPQKPNDPDAYTHWYREICKLKTHLENRFGSPITDCRLRAAIASMNRERRLRRNLADLMRADHPPFTGRQLLDFRSSISCIPADLAQYQAALRDLSTPPAPAPSSRTKSPVRVLMTGVPVPSGAERVLDLIENTGVGGLVVALESCSGLKPILEDVDESAADPLRAIADKYFHLSCSVMTTNHRRLELLGQLAREYRAECIIDLVWQACLTYDVESLQVRRLAEEDLGIPYLRIETDYSPSDTARIVTRVEALYETVRQRPTNPSLRRDVT